jgi:hypothetical protein
MFSFLNSLKNTALNKKQKEAANAEQTKRKMLIKNAIVIHKRQSELLDNLNEETKNRLQAFAMKSVFKIKGKE